MSIKDSKRYSKPEEIEKLHFDNHARFYDKNYGYFSDFTKYKIDKKVDEFVSSIVSLGKWEKIRILEIGCGTGEYTRLIARMLPNSDITALDISPKIISIAKKKCKGLPNVKFVIGSAYNTEFRSSVNDVVCGFYVLHHLNVDKLCKEAKRLLRRGGLLYFSEPNILNPLVYLIKSNSWLKNRVGDSPNEWAINPLTIAKSLRGFRMESISTGEFIWPVNFLPTKFLIFLDRLTSIFSKFPVIKYFGGTVRVISKKI